MTTRVKPKVRTVEEYLALPYTMEIYRDDSDGATAYVACVAELPGCLTQADSFKELEEMVQDAMRAWIEAVLEDGQPIPEPLTAAQFSGNLLYGCRVPYTGD